MPPQDWADQQSRRVAAAIRNVRKTRKRSAQWLADRTAELGYPISRATLADLENGRRKWVTISELIVLARALNTAPVALMYPDPLSAEVIELLPGVEQSKLFALQWFSGEVDIPQPSVCDDPDEYRANLEPVQVARRVSELESQKFALARVFIERTDKEARDKAIPEIAKIQREIDNEISKLRGTDGG